MSVSISDIQIHHTAWSQDRVSGHTDTPLDGIAQYFWGEIPYQRVQVDIPTSLFFAPQNAKVFEVECKGLGSVNLVSSTQNDPECMMKRHETTVIWKKTSSQSLIKGALLELIEQIFEHLSDARYLHFITFPICLELGCLPNLEIGMLNSSLFGQEKRASSWSRTSEVLPWQRKLANHSDNRCGFQ